MPVNTGEATQMIGPLAPALVCWASLIVTVLALGLTFLWTNVASYARRVSGGKRVPTAGSMTKSEQR
jgi:hypothetical protein